MYEKGDIDLTSLTWLHLSDWHQHGNSFDRRIVRDKLIEDIEKRTSISNDLSKIDLVIFSGDVAFSGKAEEYRAAIEYLFDPVLTAAGLSKDKLFIVPGNHDLDRSKLDFLPRTMPYIFDKEEQVQDWLTDDKKRAYVLQPFEAYNQFVKEYIGQDETAYATVRKLKISDKQVALLGLNTAWMCGRKVDERGYLAIGEPQVHDALHQMKSSDIRIAVLHHPFDWLVDFDRARIERLLTQEFHFILCGHLHEPQIFVQDGMSGNCVIIPGGASYDRRVASSPRYNNAYNFVHLDFKTQQNTVYLRRWSDPRRAWIEDIDSVARGQFTFPFPKISRIELPVTTESDPHPSAIVHNQTKSCVVDCTGNGDFRSIRDAIEKATAGEKIIIRPGEYTEKLIIDKPLELIGEGKRDEIVIQAEMPNQDCILFQTNMGYISNIKLLQKGGGEGCCIRIIQGHLHLENCDLTGNGQACITIHGDNASLLRKNSIHDGKVGVLFYNHGKGILQDNDIFDNDTGVEIIDNSNPLLLYNHIHDNKQSGVFVRDKGQGLLIGNDIFSNTNTGVEIKDGGDPIVRNNLIYNGKAGGIYIFNGGLGTLEWNDIYQNTYSGVAIKGEDTKPILRYNRIHDNRFGGVYVSDKGQGLIEENDIYSNLHAEIEIVLAGNPTLKRNRIHNGKEAGVTITESGLGTLENNDIFENFFAGIAVLKNGNPVVMSNRITKNRQAVWIEQGGRGKFENNDVRGNTEAIWEILDSAGKVTRTNNKEI